MQIDHLCNTIKQRVAMELQEAAGASQRGEILISALYEVSRDLLPLLGAPRKTEAYLEAQGKVLDLISFIAIPLIRHDLPEPRGVAVLSEIAEGCQDLLLKKKLSVYAQELLAKANQAKRPDRSGRKPGSLQLSGCFAAALLALYCILLFTVPAKAPERVGAAVAPPAVSAERDQARQVERKAEAMGQGEAAGKGEGSAEAAAPSVHAMVAAIGEQTTKVRIVNSQVLVPVTLKNRGETVRVELVLDTGATRSAIHEEITSRLPIDLSQARSSLAMLADGRVIRSRLAKVDAVQVGPFAVACMELELIPFHGGAWTHDGLLGMDFLGKHRYQIDMEHELIRWF